MKAFDEEGQTSAFLYLTQGIVQMNVGDLERARESLEKAQAAAPSDPRVYAALGTLHRRRGDARAADQNYGFALRYEKDHSESLLGLGAPRPRLGQLRRACRPRPPTSRSCSTPSPRRRPGSWRWPTWRGRCS